MIVGRVLGWVGLLAGLILLGRDLLGWLDTRRLEPLTIDRLWLSLHPASLVALQHYLPGRLWNAAAPALQMWAWPAPLILGFVLIVACRPRDHHVRRRR
jgi:hypothetical protein